MALLAFFDALLPIGRTNGACPESPATEAEALAVMDRYGVSEALAFHVAGRDFDPVIGNHEIAHTESPRLHRIFAFEPAVPALPTPARFLDDALAAGAKAILVNPANRHVRIERSVRIRELAGLMAARRMPLIAAYRWWQSGEDVIDWYGLADFCRAFPELPVIAWQLRARANRPLLDAMAEAPNLRVVLSTLWQAQMLECLHDTFGPDRVLFSLGLPHCLPGTFQTVVTCADIPPAAREAVAAGNIRCLMAEARYE